MDTADNNDVNHNKKKNHHNGKANLNNKRQKQHEQIKSRSIQSKYIYNQRPKTFFFAIIFLFKKNHTNA